jgi:hypothetical protein
LERATIFTLSTGDLMRRRLAIAAILLCTLSAASLAYAATVTLYPGTGVGGARLGAADSSAVIALKKVLPLKVSRVDNNYAGQRVYEYFFGAPLAHKATEAPHYPVEMYANKSHRVFIFEVNSPMFVTANGIKVGSTETQLRTAYVSALKKRTTPTYYIYWTGTMSNRTDFYVSRSSKKIARILISRY